MLSLFRKPLISTINQLYKPLTCRFLSSGVYDLKEQLHVDILLNLNILKNMDGKLQFHL